MSDEESKCPHSPTHTHNADGELIRVCKFCKEPMPIDGVIDRESKHPLDTVVELDEILDEVKENGTS